MYAVEIERPGTIAAAAAALGHDGAQALGGGQTLIPSMKARLASPETLISLTGIGEMQGVCIADHGALCIGGATTMRWWHARRWRISRASHIWPA